MSQELQQNETNKKSIHSQLYKCALWATVVVFSVVTLVTILVLLLDGFTSLTGSMVFIVWQTFWFGFLSVIFARFYEQNTTVAARGLAIAGIVSAVFLLTVGVFQALGGWTVSYYGAWPSFVDRLQWALSVFLYYAILMEVQLKVKSDVRVVMIVRNAAIAALTVFAVVLDMILLAVGWYDIDEVVVRILVVLALLSITCMVVTRILVAIYKKNEQGVGMGNMNVPEAKEEQKFNKAFFLERLREETGRSKQECMIISTVFENHFLVGRNEKAKIIADLCTMLGVDEEEGDKLYNTGVGIIMKAAFTRK